MPQRQYEVEADNVLPDGFWPGEALEAGPTPGDLEQLMVDAAAVLKMVGGTFSIVAIRQELTDVSGNPTGLFVPLAYRAKWESFAPAKRVQPPIQEAPAPTPEPEPDPVEEQEPLPAAEVEPWPDDAERALAAEPA